jgi:hypothetical protein
MVEPEPPPRAEVVWTATNCLVVRLQFRPRGRGQDREMFEVLSLRDDKIREMADYRTGREATRAAKRLADPTGR